jgi:hypothetical protein
MQKLLGVVAVVLFWTVTAEAQTPTPVTATSQVAFTPSADHSLVDAFGNTIVTRYDLETSAMNSLGVIFFTQQLAKPTPDATNTIHVNIASTVAALTGGTVYQARVAAVGPGGVGRSTLSNPFGKASPKVPAATGTPAIQ